MNYVTGALFDWLSNVRVAAYFIESRIERFLVVSMVRESN